MKTIPHVKLEKPTRRHPDLWRLSASPVLCLYKYGCKFATYCCRNLQVHPQRALSIMRHIDPATHALRHRYYVHSESRSDLSAQDLQRFVLNMMRSHSDGLIYLPKR